MARVITAMAVLTAMAFLLATTPAVAAAETCMCVAAQPTWDGTSAPLTPHVTSTQFEPEQLEPGQLFVAEAVTPFESVEVGPFFSSDGSLLTSSPRATRPTRSGPREVLWCASPDDPRCSGRDVPQERGPQTGDASHGAAPGTLNSPSLDAYASGTLPRGPVEGGARPAWMGRLERPPQG